MIIGINGNEANVTHRVGIGQYGYELLKGLRRLATPALRFCVYLEKAPLPDMPRETGNWLYQVLPGGNLWTLTTLQGELLKAKFSGRAPDLFFTPTHYAPLICPMPSVIAVMDLSFTVFPQYFKKKDYYQLKYWTLLSAKFARKILTISEFSKKAILEKYGFSEDKVRVVYPGYDRDRFNPQVAGQTEKIREVKEKYRTGERYLFYLGTLQPRKNLVRLIEAFKQLEDKNVRLVVAGMIREGRGGWMYSQIFGKVKELELNDRVIFTGFVSDADVPLLLAGSQAYLLPSLYEGFGIPAVEAMATGVPLVVSRVTSLPEICGPAPIFIQNPLQTDEITLRLREVLNLSPQERQKRIKLGLRQAKRYNWEVAAKQALEILIEAKG